LRFRLKQQKESAQIHARQETRIDEKTEPEPTRILKTSLPPLPSFPATTKDQKNHSSLSKPPFEEEEESEEELKRLPKEKGKQKVSHNIQEREAPSPDAFPALSIDSEDEDGDVQRAIELSLNAFREKEFIPQPDVRSLVLNRPLFSSFLPPLFYCNYPFLF